MLLSGAGAGTEAGAGSKLDWLHNTDRSTWYCTVTYIGTCTQTPSVTDSYNFTRIQNLKKICYGSGKENPSFSKKKRKYRMCVLFIPVPVSLNYHFSISYHAN